MKNPFVTVIIPTYRDWQRLSRCLQALGNQNLDHDMYEVIVVNNEIEHQVPVDFSLPSHIHVHLLHEPLPGSYAARNAALRLTKGDIVGFTDSDCIPEPDWLQNALKYFEDPSVDRIAGKVELFFENSKQKTAAELYESVFSFDQERNVRKFRASITANFFTKRKYFDTVGLFDSTKKSGEDFGWNRRANKEGILLKYASNVVVKHPARASLASLAEKKRRVFGGKKTFNFKSIKGILKEIVYPPFLFYNAFLIPLSNILFKKDGFTFLERARIAFVILFLYAVTQIEYFRLLIGGKAKR